MGVIFNQVYKYMKIYLKQINISQRRKQKFCFSKIIYRISVGIYE